MQAGAQPVTDAFERIKEFVRTSHTETRTFPELIHKKVLEQEILKKLREDIKLLLDENKADIERIRNITKGTNRISNLLSIGAHPRYLVAQLKSIGTAINEEITKYSVIAATLVSIIEEARFKPRPLGHMLIFAEDINSGLIEAQELCKKLIDVIPNKERADKELKELAIDIERKVVRCLNSAASFQNNVALLMQIIQNNMNKISKEIYGLSLTSTRAGNA